IRICDDVAECVIAGSSHECTRRMQAEFIQVDRSCSGHLYALAWAADVNLFLNFCPSVCIVVACNGIQHRSASCRCNCDVSSFLRICKHGLTRWQVVLPDHLGKGKLK